MAHCALGARCRALRVLEGARRTPAAFIMSLLVVVGACAAIGRRSAAHRAERTLAAGGAVFLARHRNSKLLGRAAWTRQRGTSALRTVVPFGAVCARRRALCVLKGARRTLVALLLRRLVVVGSCRAVCRVRTPHRTEGPLAAGDAVLLARHHLQRQVLPRASRARQRRGGAQSTVVSRGAVLTQYRALCVLVRARRTLDALLLRHLVAVGAGTAICRRAAADWGVLAGGGGGACGAALHPGARRVAAGRAWELSRRPSGAKRARAARDAGGHSLSALVLTCRACGARAGAHIVTDGARGAFLADVVSGE